MLCDQRADEVVLGWLHKASLPVHLVLRYLVLSKVYPTSQTGLVTIICNVHTLFSDYYFINFAAVSILSSGVKEIPSKNRSSTEYSNPASSMILYASSSLFNACSSSVSMLKHLVTPSLTQPSEKTSQCCYRCPLNHSLLKI